MKRFLIKIPVIGSIILFGYRFMMGLSFFKAPVSNFINWLFTSRETTNLTYDLDADNVAYLTHFVAEVTGKEYKIIQQYIREIEQDAPLKEYIQRTIQASPEGFKADKEVRFGRRIGWYALVRATKPRVVIETGVDKGLGSCVLIRALMRNREEGFPGKYYGTDINPKAGYLLGGPYAAFGEILYGDSIQSLKKLNVPIDLFINDSDHSADYEQAEYQAVRDRLSDASFVIGDNSHVTSKLQEFALETNRKFLFFQEQPKQHWYRGAGIGVAYKRVSSV
jgi:predicted O-methyltransferase YrrM